MKFVKLEEFYDEFEKFIVDVEDVLKELGFFYRVVFFCLGDLGFFFVKIYDIEVWMLSYGRYVEIFFCLNFESY